LPRKLGHDEGSKRIKDIADLALELGIETITFYAFSTEN